jgi:DNA repair exonuclease SbcCD ATPase subunit
LTDVVISSDRFSFRDLFKYSYLKQTEIDNEDIMREKDYIHNIKRKATFEIIFNLFDAALDSYKDTLKKKEAEYKELEIRLRGINDFLTNVELTNINQFTKEAKELSADISQLKSSLAAIKQNKGINTFPANNLRKCIIEQKDKLKKMAAEKTDQQDYLNKLRLLVNQYESEIEKRQMTKDGYFTFGQYEFAYCPNCLKPIAMDVSHDCCCLCGSEKSDSSSELLILEKEIKQIRRKLNELTRFIEVEDKKLDKIITNERQCQKNLAEAEQELQHLYSDYDNPQLEQIELLNYEIGQKMRFQYELEQKLKMIEELEGIEKYLKDKSTSLERLRATIRELSKVTTDRQTVIGKLSNRFTQILEAFKYPKLSNSYIDEKNYLPYVRGNKYNDIGSLAGVSLITMAYYLAILLDGVANEYHHLNLLLIDSPRKNLGAKTNSEADEEFMDEKIYNAIIRFFIKIGNEYADEFQLIVVNNSYPDFLPNNCIVAEFDTERDDLPNGFIDDIK